MTLSRRQLMAISCIIENTTIQGVAASWGVSDAAIHHFLNGREIRGRKSTLIRKKFKGFVTRSLGKYNMTYGNHTQISV